MVFGLFGKKKPRPESDIGALIAEMKARTGADTRAAELPAWALLYRSPFRTYDRPATSWLGGVPRAPNGFNWPKGRDDRPLHFIAQIDLSALKPESTTGARPPGLPERGALLVFVGLDYATHILSEADVTNGAPIMPPDDLPDLAELGFWSTGNIFCARAVDPVPYLSRGEDWPDALPNPFATPAGWLTNWGITALEAALMIEVLERELSHGREFVAYHKKEIAAGRTPPTARHIEERLEHCAMMEDHAPAMLAELHAWHDAAVAKSPEAAVNRSALDGIFAKREAFAACMKNNYGARHLLPGDAGSVWARITRDLPDLAKNQDFSQVPPAYRPLVEAKITGWRGHRLFGIEPEFPNNGEDLRGQDPLISIASDALLGTQSEHDYGFSVWLDRERMARGNHHGGQFIRHCAV